MVGDFNQIKYELFDAPNHQGNYLERLQYLQCFSHLSPKIEVPKALVCEGRDHVIQLLEGGSYQVVT